jgi:hypothetical protein
MAYSSPCPTAHLQESVNPDARKRIAVLDMRV